MGIEEVFAWQTRYQCAGASPPPCIQPQDSYVAVKNHETRAQSSWPDALLGHSSGSLIPLHDIEAALQKQNPDSEHPQASGSCC